MNTTDGRPEDDQTVSTERESQQASASADRAGPSEPAPADATGPAGESRPVPDPTEPTAPCADAPVDAAAASEEAAAPVPDSGPDLSPELERHAEQLRALHEGTGERLRTVQETLEALSKQISFLPPQLRMFGAKIDGLGTTISEPRHRSLLLGLASILDLVDQMRRSARTKPDQLADHLHNYEVLYTQLRQLLEGNGLSEISVDGPFDPKYHRALERIESSDPADADRILEVVRPGFRTEQAVLRYAEVKVAYHRGSETKPGRPEDADAASSAGSEIGERSQVDSDRQGE